MHGHGLIAAFPKLIITVILFFACFLTMTLAHDQLNHGVLTLDVLLEHCFASFFTPPSVPKYLSFTIPDKQL
jgi:hypothetical protein